MLLACLRCCAACSTLPPMQQEPFCSRAPTLHMPLPCTHTPSRPLPLLRHTRASKHLHTHTTACPHTAHPHLKLSSNGQPCMYVAQVQFETVSMTSFCHSCQQSCNNQLHLPSAAVAAVCCSFPAAGRRLVVCSRLTAATGPRATLPTWPGPPPGCASTTPPPAPQP